MIPKECKRLIEVDFPIAEVSKQSAREKSIRHGHPSTLHLWWARRPLAACRSVLMGLLLPDPCDENCPEDFKSQARELLPELVGRVGKSDEDLRAKLLKFIADFSNWDHSAHPTYLKIARGLVKAAHGEEPPLVVDPFAGGGSIPLEALRIGCDAFASDLNPVACLILKVLLEHIPRHGKRLAEELRKVGSEIKAEAEIELAEFYPADPDGSKPIAYLWARTVTCETPGCGAEIPLVRSFWLSKRAGRKNALRTNIVRKKGKLPLVEFEIFKPKKDSEVRRGTVHRAKAECLVCNSVLSPDRVHQQLSERAGGADSAKMLAVVTLNPNGVGRGYRLPTLMDYAAVDEARKVASELSLQKLSNGISLIPDEPTPLGGGSGAGRAFSCRIYGIDQWRDLFTSRQQILLSTLVDKLNHKVDDKVSLELMAMVLGRCADHWSGNAMWIQDLEAVAHTFGRQALPMVWDFVEAVGFGDGGASFLGAIDWVGRVVDFISAIENPGTVSLADARKSPLSDASSAVWFTDPPYYDAVPYAELSDYFYVWQKRLFVDDGMFADPFDPLNPLTPKVNEIVQDETKRYDEKPKGKEYFETAIGRAFEEGHRILRPDGVASVVFAHKTTEGWEALLNGMMMSGWVVTASWPITTERGARMRAHDSAALSASIHLICRPRPERAGVGEWSEIYKEMKKRVADWMERLDAEGVHGADLVFACIGPALEVYSRYEKVVDADDREIPLGGDPLAAEPYQRGYLAYIWEVVGRTALEQVLGTAEARARNGAAGVLEEDARLTALFLWTLMSTVTDNGNNDNDDNDDHDDEDEAAKSKKKSGYSLGVCPSNIYLQVSGAGDDIVYL